MSKKKRKRKDKKFFKKKLPDCAFCLGPGGILRRIERPCCAGCALMTGHMASSSAEEAARIRSFARRKS